MFKVFNATKNYYLDDRKVKRSLEAHILSNNGYDAVDVIDFSDIDYHAYIFNEDLAFVCEVNRPESVRSEIDLFNCPGIFDITITYSKHPKISHGFIKVCDDVTDDCLSYPVSVNLLDANLDEEEVFICILGMFESGNNYEVFENFNIKIWQHLKEAL